MHPVLFRIGAFEVTSFGVLVAIGVLVGLWVMRRELTARGLPREISDAAVTALIGGVLGAKLLFVAEHWGEEPLRDLLLSRGGMSWFGGLLGGVAAGIAHLYRRGWLRMAVLAAGGFRSCSSSSASTSASRSGSQWRSGSLSGS